MGINAWNAFVLRVEHPYIVRKSIWVSPPSMARKLHVADCRQQTKVSLSVVNYSQPHKKHSIRAAVHKIR